MIYIGSVLNVCDNSGVKKVKCIKVLRRSPKKWGRVGDIFIVVIKNLKVFNKIKKKEIYKGILVRSKKKVLRKDGSCICFSENSIILLNNKLVPIGSRIFGPVSRELRSKKNSKLIALSSDIL